MNKVAAYTPADSSYEGWASLPHLSCSVSLVLMVVEYAGWSATSFLKTTYSRIEYKSRLFATTTDASLDETYIGYITSMKLVNEIQYSYTK
jgi:hypothetical protein